MGKASGDVFSIAGTCPGRHEPANGHPHIWHETDWRRWVLGLYEAQGLTGEEAQSAASDLDAHAGHEPYWVGVLCDFDGQPRRHCIVPVRQGGFYLSEIPVWHRSAEVAGVLLQQWQANRG